MCRSELIDQSSLLPPKNFYKVNEVVSSIDEANI